MIHCTCTSVALLLLYAANPAACEAKGEPLYRISSGGSSELLLRVGDDPCEVVREYCNSTILRRSGSLNSEECFKQYQRAVLTRLLADWNHAVSSLAIEESLFINCAPIDSEGNYSNLQCNAQTPFVFESANDKFSCKEDGLIPELIALLQNPPGGKVDEAIATFDSRRNEVKMTPTEMVQLFGQAVLIQPNSTLIVNQFGLALMYTGQNDLARQLFENAVARNLWAHPLQRPELNFIPGLTSKPWHDTTDYPFIAKLEAGYEIIKRELLYNLREEKNIFRGEQGFINQVNDKGEWTALRLKVDRGYTELGQRYFPKTVKLLQDCQVFLTAMFSAIRPGTRILPHTGPSNDRLRSHLTIIHTGGAQIRVGTEWRTWEEGKAVIMDTSWEHEVVHNGSDLRVVLIVDFWHPEFPMCERPNV